LLMGFDLWAANPLTGVGPGAWKPATKADIESHSLYGQLLGEMGTVGTVMFALVIGTFLWNFRKVRAIRKGFPEWRSDLPSQVPAAVAVALFLLLFMGFFGHNLFRFSWLWYGGFLIIARHCLERRVREVEAQASLVQDEVVSIEEGEDTAEPEAVPAGWVWHERHS
jgi:O-antigen ligase